ncbi:unnamed protein product [Blepharisma stoltei]|uniref:Protein-tyrosine-phosphatase n=1 Tax=Blepharisma stoltei TaxID=1481888 RepID=A0AAU9I9C6_9CILI|nr:unnamed protein product [Blepharisma stoltei]
MICIDKIDDGIYLGNEAAASRLDLLKNNGISHIIVAGIELEPHFPIHFSYKKLEVLDRSEEKIDKYFEECNEFIDEAINSNNRVFIHCYQGVSRSCSIAAAYLISKKKFSPRLALDYIKSKHFECNPNKGFCEQLESYGKRINMKRAHQKNSTCCQVF